MFAPSLRASRTKSARSDMVLTSFHGMADLLSRPTLPGGKCYPCPRTRATHVPGLYKGGTQGGSSEASLSPCYPGPEALGLLTDAPSGLQTTRTILHEPLPARRMILIQHR